MLKELMLSVANALWYLLTRRHILEGRYNKLTGFYRNWDGSHRARPEEFKCPNRLQPDDVERPKEVGDLASLVGDAKRISCVGAGHSFNDLHLNNELLVSLDNLSGVAESDGDPETVSFLGGTRMRQVNDEVARLGLALPLLPDHNAQSVGGVLATDVHASGNPGYISQYVTRLEVMDGKGEIQTAEKGSRLFRATIGGMGCTGIIVEATFKPVPQFHLESRTFSCTFEELVENLDAWYEEYDHFGAAYFAAADRCVVEVKKRTEAPKSRLGPFREDLKHSLEAISLAFVLPVTVRFGRFGKKLGGFLLRLVMRLGDLFPPLVLDSWEGFNRNVYHIHKEVEFTCRPEAGRKVLRRVREVFENDPNHSYYMIGLRRTRRNEHTLIGPGSGDPNEEIMWMAPHSVGTRTRPQDETIWREIVEDVGGKPHYGKNMLGISPEYIVSQQPEWDEYLKEVEKRDPTGKLTNALVAATMRGSTTAKSSTG